MCLGSSSDADLAVCSSPDACPQQSSALLQLGSVTSSRVHSNVTEYSATLQAPAGVGATAKLNQRGFNEVVAACCAPEMVTFMTRIITKKLKLKVCHIGG